MRTSGGLSALLGRFSAPWSAGFGSAPGVPGPRSGPARPGWEHTAQCASGRPRAPRPAPLPLRPTFSQLSELLHSAPRSAPLMNYSAARDPISAPGPPGRARAGGGSPRSRAPPSSARRRPAQSRPRPAQPGGPAPLRSARSLPLGFTLPAGAECSRPRGASSATPGRGLESARQAHPQPAGAGPRGPGGTPTPATSRSAPARRVPCEDAPRRPARWGRGATPGRLRPVPGAPAWARAEAPTESPARGVGVYPLRGGSELGGLAPPKLRADPTGARRRHGAPGFAVLGFTRSRFGR